MGSTYDGFYARFTAPSKDDGALLAGSDTLVGDFFDLEVKTEDGVSIVWAKNRFGAVVGSFDYGDSRRIQLALAREMKVRAILSFVAYSELPDPGCFWGEVAIICYSPTEEDVFDRFTSAFATKLADGVRLNPALGEPELQKVRSDPSWLPHGIVPLPESGKGTAVLKSRLSMKEKMVEEGRKGNKGCYAASIIGIIVVVVLLVLLVRTCL